MLRIGKVESLGFGGGADLAFSFGPVADVGSIWKYVRYQGSNQIYIKLPNLWRVH